MTMANKGRYAGKGGGFYGGVFEPPGEYECSGSSGRIDAEVTVSEGSSAPKRKCISLNSTTRDSFKVPKQVLPVSSMMSSERRDLIGRLRTELEQIQVLQKGVEMHRCNGVTVSSSSDIYSYSNGPKKQYPVAQKVQELNRGNTGRFKSVSQALTPNSATGKLMKKCAMVLQRVMNQRIAHPFNKPVDIVVLKIPDYFTIIKHPMDLGTIQKKLSSGSYSSPLEFAADVRLTFTNAMTYNSSDNVVHKWADELRTNFELKWIPIEKELQKTDPPVKSARTEDMEPVKPILPSRKRTITSMQQEVRCKPAKPVMSMDDKNNLRKDLESLPPDDIPQNIIDFLREHSSEGSDGAIEIDIDVLSDDTLFTLRKLLDKYAQEKQKNHMKAEPCSMEHSGLSNSSMQPCAGNYLAEEDVDIGGNEPPVSSYPPVEIEKDTDHRSSKNISPSSSDGSDSSSSESDSDDDSKALSPVLQHFSSEAQADEKTMVGNPLEGTQSDSGLDQVEQTSQPKPSSVESASCQDGDSAPTERPISPEKQRRAALLKKRWADTILKAQEKTFDQGDKGDPEKLRRQREVLELQQKKEKARLQAEAKAAEEATRKKEAEAMAEAKRKRELDREAFRQALLQMEKTVEIHDPGFLQNIEMQLLTKPLELPVSVDETSPGHSEDGSSGFNFRGSKPLEQLGLFMKEDKYDEEEEEEADLAVPNPVDDVEEGQID